MAGDKGKGRQPDRSPDRKRPKVNNDDIDQGYTASGSDDNYEDEGYEEQARHADAVRRRNVSFWAERRVRDRSKSFRI